MKLLLRYLKRNKKKAASFLSLLFLTAVFSSSTVAQCLSGVYTIGGAGANYPSFKNATDALMSNGICGPVNFKINDGVYAGDITIPKVAGSSQTNTITFESLSSDSSKVSINDADHVNLTINSSNVIIKSIGFYRVNGKVGLYEVILKIADSVQNITISNCNFKSEECIAVDFLYATTLPKVTIVNTNFISLSPNPSNAMAIRMNAYLWINEHGYSIEISKNTFKNFLNAISVRRCGSLLIQGNNIRTGTILVDDCVDFRISENKISNGGIGVSMCFYGSDPLRLIENNFINNDGENGIGLYGGEQYKVYSNTVNLKRLPSRGACLSLSSNSACEIKNNIFNMLDKGTLVSIEDSQNNQFDYNNYYALNPVFFSTVDGVDETLTQWKQRTGQDAHSLSHQPQFISPTDLHLRDYNLNNKGTPTIVNVDIDREARSSISPDIGADEYSIIPLVNDAQITSYDTLLKVCGNALKPVVVKLYNNGSASLTSATLNWKLDGVLKSPFMWTGNIQPGAFTTLKIGNYSNLNSQITVFIVDANHASEVNTFNDTCLYSPAYKIPLTGNYTIAETGADFIGLTEAASYLNRNGVCGPVTFTIKKGTYYTCAVFDSIDGSSATNTITIMSETNNLNDVRLVNLNAKATPIVLYNADYINFKNLTIIFPYYAPVYIKGCSYINFENVRFYGSSILCESPYDHKLSFINCRFDCPLTIYSIPNSIMKTGLVITGCTFNSEAALNISNVDSMLISNNKFLFAGQTSGGATMMSVRFCKNADITKNYLNGRFSSGLEFIGMGVLGSGHVNISNNVVKGVDYEDAYLVKVEGADSLTFAYNTCIAAGPTPNTNTVGLFGDNTNVKFTNNIITNYGEGAAVMLGGAESYSIADHNVFYSKNSLPIYQLGLRKTLAEYKAESGLQNNSFVTDPEFLAGTQLRFLNDTIRSIGIPIAEVADDIENILRNSIATSPGAYESHPDTVYDYIHKDLQVVKINDTLTTGENVITVSFKSKLFKEINNYNKHEGTIDTIDMSYKLSDDAWITEQWTGHLRMNQTLDYNFLKKVVITKGKLFNLSVTAKLHSQSMIDTIPTNDTLFKRTIVPMKGVYTVGGDEPDFATAASAMESLKICGELGAVTFSFRAGTYEMLNIEGKDTLTLRSESGTPYDVRIQCSRIHASNISFKKLMLYCHQNQINNTYQGLGTEILTANFTLDSCVIDIDLNDPNPPLNNPGLEFLSSSNVTITNNEFSNASRAITYNPIINVNGATGIWGGKHEISNNVFTGCGGIFSIYKFDSSPTGNITPKDSINFHDNKFHWGGKSVSIGVCDSVYIKLYNNEMQLYVYGVKNYIPVYNNFISNATFIRAANVEFVNNSLNEFLEVQKCANMTFKNNSFFATGGVAINIDDSTTFTSDYNNYYTADSRNLLMQFNGGLHSPYFVFANSLDSLRTLTKQDQHSISVNPYYKKTTFLDHHSNSIHLKNKGIHVPLVKTDIDGQPRNTLMPDIGADEIDLTADVVWPGDADADSKVTGRDLLSLGLYTGETGFTRTTVNNEWLPQESVDWNKNQYNMANLKHADCNGDGIVDANDTLAVSQNFGLVHNKNSRLAANNQVMSAGNDLHFIVTNPKKQFKNMEKINVEIWLGKAASTANDVYGISFDVAFLNRYVANGTFKMVANDSWLGTVSKSGMNTYSLTSKDESIGMAYAAVVRNDHKNASGYGKIASFSFLFTDPAGSNAPLSEDLFLLFQNAVLINASGNELTVTPHNNSITNYVGDITTGISTESTNALSVTIVPNPFSGYARLNYVLENDAATELEISNVLGKVVYTMFKGTQRAGKHEFQIDTKEMGLSSGMYFISLTVGKQKITNKVVITD